MADPTPVDRSRPQPLPLVPRPDRDRLGTPPPASLTSFIGREREVEQVCDLMRGPDVRLVTLTGPGGVGKTRLAIAIARQLADSFPDGVAFVSLAPVRDLDLVWPTVAQALGVRDAGDAPLTDRLTASLRDKRLLLVLDNFEQVVEAAPLVAALLVECPGLKVLATSRVRLRVSGEREHEVPPLALEEETDAPVGVAGSAAVRLFVERAQAVRADFGLTVANAPAVAAICRRVDGLPLAIELAAARVKVLPPAALLERLERRLPVLTGGGRDLPTRQQTMRAAIAWSYDLLTAAERALFLRLGVFVGGVTLEAAEAVCTVDGLASDVLEGIASLVDKSLLRQEEAAGEPRYRMLETVREFALEQLAAGGAEAATRDQHATWCLSLGEAAGAVLWRSDDPGVVARLEAELANLRAALGWLEQAGRGDDLLRLAAAVGRFWYVAGHHREGRAWLERALAMASPAPTPARVRGLLYAGLQAIGFDDAAAFRAHEAAAGLARDLGLAEEAAVGELGQGIVLEDRGDYAAAEARFAAALPRFREAGNDAYELTTTYHLGVAAHGRGETDRAHRLWEETLAAARARGEPVLPLGAWSTWVSWPPSRAPCERQRRSWASAGR